LEFILKKENVINNIRIKFTAQFYKYDKINPGTFKKMLLDKCTIDDTGHIR